MLALMQNLPVIRYLVEVKDEVTKVTWPSRQQTINKTILVIVVSVGVGTYIGLLDYIYTQLATLILK